MTFALDLETTGLSVAEDRVAEVGVAGRHADGETCGLVSLVRPGRPLSPSAAAVNGLRDEDLERAPPFPRVWVEVVRFVGARDPHPVVLTWGGMRFDWPMLRAELARYGIQRPRWRVCDLYPYWRAVKQGSGSLEAACARFGVRLDRAGGHSAGRDAVAVLDLHARMLAAGVCPSAEAIASAQALQAVAVWSGRLTPSDRSGSLES